ncbi:MAG: hypothetical protein SGJ11_13960 [Phycisphaerae bacterium]|nr:hypothetical protein [Phycisphaerae bacterium]
MKRRFSLAAAAAFAGAAALVHADIVVDGSLDAEYGAALAVQNVMTQFGDSNLGSIDFANGSELDVGHGVVVGNTLHLFLAGNIESNFNKLEVFIDFGPGGQNQLRGDNPDVDFNGLNRMGDDGTGVGLTFDPGFEADFYVTATCGGGPFATYANTAQILTKGGGTGEFIGSGGAGARAVLVGSNGTLVGLNNSNVRGVIGGAKAASGAGVTTGIEIALPLALLEGYAGGEIKVCAFINGGGHDFVSNQVLGGIGPSENLGEPRFVNFKFLPGDQFFVVGGGGGQECVGDINNSGAVDASDLAILLGAWGSSGGDLNGDGTTDASDLATLLGAWGGCP